MDEVHGVRIRAAVLERDRRAADVEELELAPPGPGEVLVRLHASGVCHSDLTRSTARPRRAARPCSATRAPASSRRSAPA